MSQHRVPAVFMRGGTSKGLFFHARDLPTDRARRDKLFLAAMGSPDGYGRQLDGMGGGVSSLSKIIIVGPSTRPDADVDFTFGQVDIRQDLVDYRGTCGNLTSAVGPFAVDEGLVNCMSPDAVVRVYNTNTSKVAHLSFRVRDGVAAVDGDCVVPGVSGSGAPIRLEFRDPGGAITGKLLPTGRPRDEIDVPGVGRVEVSVVDAANPCAFVQASRFGLTGAGLPADLEANAEALEQLERVRSAIGHLLGFGVSPEDVSRRSRSSPKIAVVAATSDTLTLDGTRIPADQMDISARMLSMGQPHRAIPLTGAICLAVAARIDGTIANEFLSDTQDQGQDIRVGTSSGVLRVAARVHRLKEWHAEYGVVYRTARRLMEGRVLVRRAALK